MQTRLVGYMEVSSGLGLISGPLIGSLLYSYLEYAKTFFVYGSFFLVFAIAACFIVKVTPKVNNDG